jgi:tyrosyl-tRNA synthetase
MPILEGLDGVQKMSKSLGNHIGINEPPEEIYGKTMSVADELMWKYFELATEVPQTDIEQLAALVDSGKMHPKEAKQRLAREIVGLYHGEEAATTAQEHFEKVIARKELPDEMPNLVVKKGEMKDGKVWVVKLLVQAGFAGSNGEARRLIQQGGIRINQEEVTVDNCDVAVKEGDVLQAGRRRFARIAVE